MVRYETRTRRFSRAEYDRLIQMGVFQPGENIELIGGELIVAEPQGAQHYTAIVRTARALEVAFGAGWYVRREGPLGLDDDSEPEPDLAVVRGTRADYREDHPARPVLIVEVAESSLAFDRAQKGSLYARAGIADYWIVNLEDRILEVYRDPGPDLTAPFGWRYISVTRFRPPDSVTPLDVPTAPIPVAALLP